MNSTTSVPHTALLAGLVKSLNVAVMEPTAEGRFRLLGEPPAWLATVYPAAARDQPFTIGENLPVLHNFLTDAADIWRLEDGAVLDSGLWTEEDASGRPWHLEATALRSAGRNLLLLRECGAEFERRHNFLQAARTQMLSQETERRGQHRSQRALSARLEETEQVRNDVLTILQQFSLAIALIDQDSKVRFLSSAAARLLELPNPPPRNAPWNSLLRLAKPDRLTLHTLLEGMAVPDPARLSCGVETQKGTRLWLDIDVHNDPRDARTKMVCLHDRSEVHHLRSLLDEKARFYDLIGRSSGMLRIYQKIQDLARVESTVLIEGETGTGKELVARALHASSPRNEGPFIAANCAGLTDSLLGSQLFGHKRGAFTGAIDDHQGLFEAAHGGTLFLDEIGDIPPHVQTSLLRVLQEKEVTRLGESRPRKVNVRVLAATHHDLAHDVAKGSFRADLLYRIRVARIHLPALRDRKEDIPLLVTKFLGDARAAMGKPVQHATPAAIARLLEYDWPGNIRELKSAIDCAVIHCRTSGIDLADLPPEIRTEGIGLSSSAIGSNVNLRGRIEATLLRTNGNRTEAARQLGMSRATFYRRLSELGFPQD